MGPTAALALDAPWRMGSLGIMRVASSAKYDAHLAGSFEAASLLQATSLSLMACASATLVSFEQAMVRAISPTHPLSSMNFSIGSFSFGWAFRNLCKRTYRCQSLGHGVSRQA